MVSRPPGRMPGSSSAPPRSPRPKPGEDALSAVLGDHEEGQASEEQRVDRASRQRRRRIEARILTALEQYGQPVSLEVLGSKVELDYFTLSDHIVDLERQHLINLQGSPGHELVSLAADSR